MNAHLEVPAKPWTWARALVAFMAGVVVIYVGIHLEVGYGLPEIAGLATFTAVSYLWRRLVVRVTMEMNGEGFRVEGTSVAWSEISGMQLGANDTLQLIRGKEPFMTIDARAVTNYPEFVQMLVRQVKFDPALLDDERSVTGEPSLNPIKDRSIDFDDDGVRIWSVVGNLRLIPVEDIEAIELVVARNLHLSTRVRVRDGEPIHLAVDGGDPFEIFANARRAYPELVT